MSRSKRAATVSNSVLSAVVVILLFLSYAVPAAAGTEAVIRLGARALSADTVEVTASAENFDLTSCSFTVFCESGCSLSSYYSPCKDSLIYAAQESTGETKVYFACARQTRGAFAVLSFRLTGKHNGTAAFGISSSDYTYAVKTTDGNTASTATEVYPVFTGASAVMPTVTEITACPSKSCFAEGETDKFLPELLSVFAVYSNGECIKADEGDYTVSGYFDGNTAGEYLLTCRYMNKEKTFSVFVYDEKICALTIAAPPGKNVFEYGERADFSDLRLSAVFPDGSTRTVSRSDATVTGFNPYIPGTQTVKAEYRNLFTEFTVTVKEKYKKGDVNSDGSVDITDARLALRIAIKLDAAEKNSYAYNAASVDADPGIQITDARLILRAAIGLEKL